MKQENLRILTREELRKICGGRQVLPEGVGEEKTTTQQKQDRKYFHGGSV